jgi:cobalt-zinc-cadmium efflux system outer membrane protein
MKSANTLAKSIAIAVIAAMVDAPYTVLAAAEPALTDTPVATQATLVTSPEPTRTLSLIDCFNRADKYNKEILSNTWNLAMAKANIRIAGAIPNPQFEFLTGFGSFYSQELGGQNSSIQWIQDIQTAGKRSKKIDLARANYGFSQLQLEALKFDVHNRVRRAFAEQAAAEAYDDLIQAEKAVGTKLLSVAKKRFAAGKAPQTEELQAELNVSQFDTQQNQAQIRLQQDSAALAQLIGEIPAHVEVIDVKDNGLFQLSAEKTEIVPSPTEPPPRIDQLLTTAYDSRPDYKAAEQNVMVQRKALSLARAQRVPDIFIGAGYQWVALTAKQLPESPSIPNFWGSGVYLTATAETPVFYQHQGEIEQAVWTLRQAERQRDLVHCQLATDVVTAYNEVTVARANIFLFQKDLLPTASEVARVARRGYEVGATDLSTAIVAQQQYQQTLSSYFDAVVAYQNAWADLEKAVGVSLTL